MNKTKKPVRTTRKLSLRREAIRALTSCQLNQAAGGTGGQHTCELTCWCRDC